MNADDLVKNLIKGTIHRAIVESVAALIVVVAFARILQNSRIGTPQYYGCLLILVSAGFVAGVVWSFALSYQLLRTHPVSDSAFWREAFLSQAKLLRLVPLWYAAPLCSGAVLFCAPTDKLDSTAFLIVLCPVIALFAFVTWLNRRGAMKLESQAAQFGS